MSVKVCLVLWPLVKFRMMPVGACLTYQTFISSAAMYLQLLLFFPCILSSSLGLLGMNLFIEPWCSTVMGSAFVHANLGSGIVLNCNTNYGWTNNKTLGQSEAALATEAYTNIMFQCVFSFCIFEVWKWCRMIFVWQTRNGLEQLCLWFSRYLDLLKDKTHYPYLMDASNAVISFPPITNSDVSKVSS